MKEKLNQKKMNVFEDTLLVDNTLNVVEINIQMASITYNSTNSFLQNPNTGIILDILAPKIGKL